MVIKKLPDNFIGYFGTMGKRSGHNLYILDGYKEISNEDQYELAALFDKDFIMRKLSLLSIKVFWWEEENLTICGYPKSLDDERPGSKSLFILKGNYVEDKEYIISKMKQYPNIYNIFIELSQKYIK